MQIKIYFFGSVQAPSLSIQDQELSFWLLYYQMHHFWLISYLPLGETDGTIGITHNAMALWNLFILNQYRSSCFCGSLIPCVSCWLQHLSWHCIIHPAIPEYWLPMILSKVVAMLFWMMATHASLICVWRKMCMIIHFWSSYMYCLKFYSGSRLQHIFQPHLLFNFLGCTPCMPRMWSLSMLTASLNSTYWHQQAG